MAESSVGVLDWAWYPSGISNTTANLPCCPCARADTFSTADISTFGWANEQAGAINKPTANISNLIRMENSSKRPAHAIKEGEAPVHPAPRHHARIERSSKCFRSG